jgi:exopolysaccharide production protein ExoQ
VAVVGQSRLARPTGWFDIIRDVVAIGWLCIASGAVYILLVQGQSPHLEPHQEAILRLFVLPSVPLAALVAVIRAREMAEVLIRLPFLALFLVLMWSSVAWSLDSGVSLRRALSVTSFTLIAVWLALAFEPEALLKRLTWIALLILVLSFAFAVLLPHLAFMLLDGQWLLRGVFSHKNGMGQHIGLSAILLATAWQFRLLPRPLVALGFVLCLGLAVPTGSATSILILLALVLIRIGAAVVSLPPKQALAVGCFGIALIIFTLLATFLWFEVLFAALGRDITFTGRVPLWEFVWLQIAKKPWLGYGFAIFFNISWVEIYIIDTLNWTIPNAHNGFFEVWLGIGIGGPISLLIFLLRTFFVALLLVIRRFSPGPTFAIYFIPIYLMRNLVESDLAMPSQLSWVLAVIAATLVLREKRRF